MRGEPFIQDWELVVGSDLASHLIRPGEQPRAHQPVDAGMIPGGAHEALARGIGRHGLDDLLLLPSLARPAGPPWRRRCLYAPLGVLGIGEHGLGLWVQALPSPGIRVMLPFGAIAVVERQAEGPWRQLIVTTAGGQLSVHYGAGGDAPVGTWLRRLRRRCAGPPEPLPGDPSAGGGPRRRDLQSFLLDETEVAVAAGRLSLPWPGHRLLAVTSREVILSWSRRSWSRPWQASTRTVYLPRGSIAEASVRSRSLLLRSAGASLRMPLPSRAAAAAATRWLERTPSGDPRWDSPEARRAGG